jgi:hypothetical protein
MLPLQKGSHEVYLGIRGVSRSTVRKIGLMFNYKFINFNHKHYKPNRISFTVSLINQTNTKD